VVSGVASGLVALELADDDIVGVKPGLAWRQGKAGLRAKTGG
jgi:hypothetical protein